MAGVVKVFHSWRCVSDAVVAALSEPTTDPFVRPILVAPGNAQSRSLLQSLARRHGIAAGIDTTTPLGLRERLEEDLLGVKRENDPWQPGSLALRICRVIENNSPGFEVVSAHLEASRRQGSAACNMDNCTTSCRRDLRASSRLSRRLECLGRRCHPHNSPG